MNHTPDIEKLQYILSQGTYSLVDEFEYELVKHILKNETKCMILCGCSGLIRNAFYITLAKYGKDANVSHFCEIVLNDNDKGRQICMEVSRQHSNEATMIKTARVARYFLCEYYATATKNTGEYTFCKPVRYLCNLILDSHLIANDLLHFPEHKEGDEIIRKEIKIMSSEDKADVIDIIDIIDDIFEESLF